MHLGNEKKKENIFFVEQLQLKVTNTCNLLSFKSKFQVSNFSRHWWEVIRMFYNSAWCFRWSHELYFFGGKSCTYVLIVGRAGSTPTFGLI